MNQGIKFILLAGFFFSIVNALVKYYSHIPAVEIVFFRSIVTLILSYIVVHKKKIQILNKHTPLLLLRGIAGSIALYLYFTTIQNIPLASAVTLLYLAPIFTIILAIFLLKEKPNIWQWPFFIISFIGAFVIKSFDSSIEMKFFVMGISSAIFAALAYNTIRMLKGKADPHLIILYFPLTTIPLILPWLIKDWVTPSPADLIGLLVIGLATQIAQVFMTKAYLSAPASKISNFNYLTTIYAVICGVVFFEERLLASTIIGLSLIIFGVIMSNHFSNKNA